ncbi:unnamed protein product [Caenorhabditis angaria]|uniref:Uncharacterized protein n=1 Tax=Caenorhabditis angaria TaxID=860376 RepID=A0A9P1J3F0_9PELO|nr:unnamed protein product [Caenorhabditis angaria]
MVFTQACVAHQSFQESAKLVREPRNSTRSNGSKNNALVDISYQGQKNIPDWIIRNRLIIVEIRANGNYFNENVFNMPIFPNLKKLSITNNRIRNIGILINHIKRSCPNLETLNVDGNPGWPNDFATIQTYRKTVASHIKSLQVLNGMDTYRRKRSTMSVTSSTDSEMSM